MSSKEIPANPESDEDDFGIVDEDDLVILEDEETDRFLDYMEQQATQKQHGKDEDLEKMEGTEDHVEPECEPSDMILSGHEGSVFCVTVDPTRDLLVSGGEDDRAIVWDLHTGRPLCALPHEESVTHVTFSRNGQLLATGDLAGHIHVWTRAQLTSSTTTNDPAHLPLPNPATSVWSETVQEELQWLHWYPHGSDNTTILLAGSGEKDGSVAVWLIVGQDLSRCNAKYLPGIDGTACVAAQHLSSQHPQTLVTLYSSGRLRSWNIRDGSALEEVNLMQWLEKDRKEETKDEEEEENLITPVSLAMRSDLENVAAVGFLSGHLLLVTLTGKQCVLSLRTKDHSSVEGLAFSSKHPYLAYGSVGGELGIIDVQTSHVRATWIQKHESSTVGVTCLRWLEHADQPLFLTGNVDGSVCVWAALKAPHSDALLRRVQVHSNTVLDLLLKEADNADMICSCGDDFTVRVNFVPAM